MDAASPGYGIDVLTQVSDATVRTSTRTRPLAIRGLTGERDGA